MNVPARTGRRTTLTPTVQHDICAALRAGHYLQTAATRAGVHPRTVYRWLALGDTEPPYDNDGLPLPDHLDIYRQFRHAVLLARTDAEHEALTIVWDTARGGTLIRQSERREPGGKGVIVDQQWTAPDARAAQWLLERGFGARWGRRDTLAIVTDPLEPGDPDTDPTGATGDPVATLAQRIVAAARAAYPDRDLPAVDGPGLADDVPDPDPDEPVDAVIVGEGDVPPGL